jgi:hypothetical protein
MVVATVRFNIFFIINPQCLIKLLKQQSVQCNAMLCALFVQFMPPIFISNLRFFTFEYVNNTDSHISISKTLRSQVVQNIHSLLAYANFK